MPTIPGLPDHLQAVPTDPAAWRLWAERIDAYRELIRREAGSDPATAAAVRGLAAEDPAYFLCVFGWIFEPRVKGDHRPGWRPWMLYPFQVELLRTITAAMTASGPEGDLVIEKSRDMGATWTV